MNHYFAANYWDKRFCKSTCKNAAPKETKDVVNARVIDAKFVNYRDSVFSGKFLLADKVSKELPNNGWHKVEVYCLWFGHRLKTRGIKLTIDMSNATVDNKFTGKVVANISQ
jgi:hypothetical protein